MPAIQPCGHFGVTGSTSCCIRLRPCRRLVKAPGELGLALQIKRTEGVSSTDIVGRMLMCTRSNPSLKAVSVHIQSQSPDPAFCKRPTQLLLYQKHIRSRQRNEGASMYSMQSVEWDVEQGVCIPSHTNPNVGTIGWQGRMQPSIYEDSGDHVLPNRSERS